MYELQENATFASSPHLHCSKSTISNSNIFSQVALRRKEAMNPKPSEQFKFIEDTKSESFFLFFEYSIWWSLPEVKGQQYYSDGCRLFLCVDFYKEGGGRAEWLSRLSGFSFFLKYIHKK